MPWRGRFEARGIAPYRNSSWCGKWRNDPDARTRRGEYHIPTLDGDEVINVPVGIAHGEVVRVRGKGVPHGRGERGDLLVRIDIDFPKKLSKHARELIDQLRVEGL